MLSHRPVAGTQIVEDEIFEYPKYKKVENSLESRIPLGMPYRSRASPKVG